MSKPMKHTDPTPDIYRIFDEAGFNAGTLMSTRISMLKLVTGLRGEIARNLKQYIEQRENGEVTPVDVVTEDSDHGKL